MYARGHCPVGAHARYSLTSIFPHFRHWLLRAAELREAVTKGSGATSNANLLCKPYLSLDSTRLESYLSPLPEDATLRLEPVSSRLNTAYGVQEPQRSPA